MKIDKYRFFLLTGAIAAATMVSVGAAGCVITTSDKDSSKDKDSDTFVEGDAGVDNDAALPTDEETDDSDASTDPDPDASTDPDAPVDPDPPACLAEAGPDPECYLELDGPCAEACSSMTWDRELKSGIANEMVDCLRTIPHCIDEGGDVTPEAWACRDEAISKACRGENEADICKPLVANCAAVGWEDTFTQEACERTVAAISEDALDDFIYCVTEGLSNYCTYEPDWCFLR